MTSDMDRPEPEPGHVTVHVADLIGPLAMYVTPPGVVPDDQPEIRPVSSDFHLCADDSDNPRDVDGMPAVSYFSSDGECVARIHLPGGILADPDGATPAVMESVDVCGERMVRTMRARDGHPADIDGPAERYTDESGVTVWTCDVAGHWACHR